MNNVEVDWSFYRGRSSKKSKEAYCDFWSLLIKNNHKLLSEYTFTTTKVLIDFKCGHEPNWTTPSMYKKGCGCPKCVGRGGQAKEDLIELINKNDHKLLSEYINNSTKVLIDFNCGHDAHWITPGHYKSGKGCPKCAVELKAKMRKNIAKEKLINTINENGHVLLSEYVNSDEKVLIDFKCGHEPHWITTPNYLKGKGCPRCKNLSPKQARETLIYEINRRGHKLLSEYINSNTKVLIDFGCGHKPSWILPNQYKRKKTMCPKCTRHCSEQVKKDFIELLKDNDCKLLSEYIDVTKKVLIDFGCGHEPHWITPHSYKRGTRCPYCINKGEGALISLIEEMGIEVNAQYIYEDLKDKQHLRFDAYLPKYNILIELDGIHHFKPVAYYYKNSSDKEKADAIRKAEENFKNKKKRDNMKTEYARNNNIPLLRIDYKNGVVDKEKWKNLILNKIEEVKTPSIA